MCCTVSVSILQNLQDGSPLNRPIICRCPLTGACPVRIATAIFSWCLPNLSRSSALFLHGLPIKSLPCLQPGTIFQVCRAKYCAMWILILLRSNYFLLLLTFAPFSCRFCWVYFLYIFIHRGQVNCLSMKCVIFLNNELISFKDFVNRSNSWPWYSVWIFHCSHSATLTVLYCHEAI